MPEKLEKQLERTAVANTAAGEAARYAEARGVRFGAAAGVQIRDHADLDTVNDAWRLQVEPAICGQVGERWRSEAGQQQQRLLDAADHVDTSLRGVRDASGVSVLHRCDRSRGGPRGGAGWLPGESYLHERSRVCAESHQLKGGTLEAAMQPCSKASSRVGA